MCQNVRARFACSTWHASLGDEATRIKHIAQCRTAIARGQSCPENQRTHNHVLQEDEPDQNCPECRGETPPETP
ncbi:hypothetical protein K469DRAFT_716329 [Zopfia rhizophila CBS 207.26]|uniref:Uncharacterized protein n=1 Tax=Zopfia rhizophila CBS 207.26 TaxID=1314779 RepID=A0A6A6DLM2_9PEZI|nr:hypothetical protein K469DRAFT_716329 [Zopfia rhizophila CBS 207.26]